MTKIEYYSFCNINISGGNLELLNLTDLGGFAHGQKDAAQASVAMVFQYRLSRHSVYFVILVKAKLLFKKWKTFWKKPCIWKKIKIGINHWNDFLKYCNIGLKDSYDNVSFSLTHIHTQEIKMPSIWIILFHFLV